MGFEICFYGKNILAVEGFAELGLMDIFKVVQVASIICVSHNSVRRLLCCRFFSFLSLFLCPFFSGESRDPERCLSSV